MNHAKNLNTTKHSRMVQDANIFLFPLNDSVNMMAFEMETFSALLAICAGNSPVPAEVPAQRPATRSFDVFFDLRLNKRSSNNREAGDLRRYRAHYDVTVKKACVCVSE